MQKPVCALDFDGTLAEFAFAGYRQGEFGAPLPGAVAACARLAERFDLAIVTARPPEDHAGILAWCKRHGIRVSAVTNIKIVAAVYIDDRAVGFRGSWSDAQDRACDLLDGMDGAEQSAWGRVCLENLLRAQRAYTEAGA